jgi:hypothetical protein
VDDTRSTGAAAGLTPTAACAPPGACLPSGRPDQLRFL